jgi:hypothetical protein
LFFLFGLLVVLGDGMNEGLEKYLHHILTNEDTAQCDIVVTFLYPIQMNDIKPGQEPSTQEKKEKVQAK